MNRAFDYLYWSRWKPGQVSRFGRVQPFSEAKAAGVTDESTFACSCWHRLAPVEAASHPQAGVRRRALQGHCRPCAFQVNWGHARKSTSPNHDYCAAGQPWSHSQWSLARGTRSASFKLERDRPRQKTVGIRLRSTARISSELRPGARPNTTLSIRPACLQQPNTFAVIAIIVEVRHTPTNHPLSSRRRSRI